MSVDFGEGMGGLQYDEIPFGGGMRELEQELESVTRTPAGTEEAPADDLRARVAGNLAMGLARILVSAIRDLEQHSTSERTQLLAIVQEQQRKLDLVRADLESLRASDQEQKAAIEGWKLEISDRMDSLFGRIELQQEELATLPPKFSEISPQVAAVVDRLDRQAEAIRAICETGMQREVLLDELSAALAQLKTAWNSGPTVPAEL